MSPTVQDTILFCVSVVVFLVPAVLWSQSQNLPLEHWAYSFLDRLQTRGLYVSEDFDTRPYSREAIAEIISQINKRAKADPTLLSKVEWGLFEQLKGEFHEELENTSQRIAIRKKEYEPHLFSYRNEDIVVHWDGLLSHQNKIESKKVVDRSLPSALSFVGLNLRANIKKSLAIFAQGGTFFLSDADSLTADSFNPSLGLPVTKNALVDVTVTDQTIAYLVFRLPWLDVEAGRDMIEWGPGFRGNLVLSRNSNVYDMFKFDFRYKRFKFESFHAFLNAEDAKYLAGHRLEIRPSRHVQFALAETVVYGNRSVEFLYFNPFAPIIIAERHLGNKDNNMVSFDASVFLKQRLKLYTELLFDDFSFAKNLFNNFVNKWGVMLGGYWVDPLGVPNSHFRFELVRIQPFVYSHRNPINTYTNYDNNMGHWLGPDADDWYFEFSQQPHRDWKFGISWEQRRRGDNDLDQGTPPEDSRIHFLDGIVERSRFYGLFAQWQIRRDLFLSVNYNFIDSKNLQRVRGQNQKNHRLLLKFSLDY